MKITAEKFCNNCYDISEPAKAVNAALNIAEADDAVIICGSFYLAGAVRDILFN